MWKKNKLPLLLLAIVAMLSIFYIYSENSEKTQDVGGDNLGGDTRVPVFAEARLQLLESRNEDIREIEASIAAGSLTDEEISEFVSLIDQIYNLKFSEIELENEIMAMGFEDCFVVSNGDTIKIDILAEEFTNADFVSVALKAKEKFGKFTAVQIAITNPLE